ncbi:unnamed protein product [Schistosoma rodhaini]|uniref:LEM domain-containing protein n=1 Tax=Schistosoma rodhaini TaxID=6188 RepID=A0AA85G9M9_9TREM|nr:unnamed protein product [Schistosoma rodhaini]
MDRIQYLTDDELRAELSEKGYFPPPIQDDVTRRILRKKLALLIDPSLVIEEPVQDPDSSDNSDTSDAAKDTNVRSRNRVRFSEPQETVYEVIDNHKRGFFCTSGYFCSSSSSMNSLQMFSLSNLEDY